MQPTPEEETDTINAMWNELSMFDAQTRNRILKALAEANIALTKRELEGSLLQNNNKLGSMTQ